MSEEFSAHAFDMFTQEKVTSRSTYQGTGLGLAIVKQLVDRMGGSVTLQSRPGNYGHGQAAVQNRQAG